VIQALREAQTKPETIAQRAFAAAMYPRHPYGRSATPETVAALAREDLVAFHRDRYGASRAVVAMIGAISRAQAEAIADRLTAQLPRGTTPPAMPPVARMSAPVERRIEHPATQSHILVGQPAIAWGDPDQFALLVGNYVLGGGGFVSRLYSEVREKRGLAYSVCSYFSPSLQAGPFTIGLQTQREQTALALQVVRDTLARFLAEGPTEEELAAAKANLVGGFALRIDSNRKILDQLASIGFYRLPLDYLDRWTERVQAVTLQQVRDAFARHVQADTLATVVVGAPLTVGAAPPGAGTTAAAPAPTSR
jgi:zinc protease